jgi:transposase InsO family protein
MNIHQNARTTPVGRELLAHRIDDLGWTPKEAADAAGVSRQTAHKWLRRHREGGRAALHDRPSIARHRPHGLPEEWVDVVVFLRGFRQPARAISAQLGIARSTVSGVLARRGVGSLRALEPPPPACRYERRHAGDLLHLDIKKLGRFHQPGHRVTGNRAKASRGAGWEFVHVAIDDFSRLAYVEILPDERGQTCAAFLRRACAWFITQGICIKRILTDNGTGYRSHRFRDACASIKLRHLRTKPRTPQTNGKAERFIQTLLREWAYFRLYRNSRERAQHLPRWLHFYNCERPHASLDYLSPISRRPQLCQQRS